MNLKDNIYHPMVDFIYFFSIILITSLCLNPLIIGISFLWSCIYIIKIKGIKKFFKLIGFLSIMMIFMVVINVLFNHKGLTVIMFLRNNNPITLEVIINSFFMSLIFSAVIFWYMYFNELFFSEKIIYITSKLSPKLSLVMSMAFNFIPKYKEKYIEVRDYRKALGINYAGNFFYKIKEFSIIIFSVLSWSMENSIKISDSMRIKGYTGKNRSSFYIYRYNKRDYILLFLMIILIAVITLLIYKNPYLYWYYPRFYIKKSIVNIFIMLLFCFLCSLQFFKKILRKV